MLEKRAPNWLPNFGPLGKKVLEPQVSVEDFFPKGEIVKFFPQQEYGFIRDQHGRDIYFHLGELDLVGPKSRKGFLKVGAKIGYDVSWTSHGLHVKRLKVY